MPLRDQIGPLVLQSKGLGRASGAWVPNWRFDAYCMDATVSAAVADGFALKLMPVDWHGAPAVDASQVIVPSSEGPWFEADQLTEATSRVHGVAGATCADCGRWRWMPVGMADLPRPDLKAFAGNPDVVASPEWFGDGAQSFRQIVWRRELADRLLSASPRDFRIQELA